ncbi:uncharacterized protein LOC124444071 [Xenia sp. Carnegie-2017]|uniref:uncharacterized protein LOC124444071 n=1 Tax=Xenia sp. Carnegie-2017 TaxID=2897299 RepID=UPI001F04FA72|nr:uncharacterized protein LOC124444071 [Xenia sp. Carnegie-2017]
MGISNSRSNVPQELKDSPNFLFLSKLFQDRSTICDGKRIMNESGFNELFSNEKKKIIELLFNHTMLMAEADNKTSKTLEIASFISAFDKIMKLDSGAKEMVPYYLNVFNNGKQQISAQDVERTLTVVYAAELNTAYEQSSYFQEVARGLVNKDKETSANKIIELWPRLFNRIHSRIVASLREHDKLYETDQRKKQDCWSIQTTNAEPIITPEILWLLSVSIPTVFFGNKRKTVKQDQDSICEWRDLYNSNEHGLSHNRFKHHVFSYRGPTVMLIVLENDKRLVLALDVEWRESTKCFGGANTRLYEINPGFNILDEESIVFFNEKTRGIPVGLVLGRNPSKPVVSLLDGLNSAKFGLEEIPVDRIKVWGCAGENAETHQKEQKKWEKRQAEKLQKVFDGFIIWTPCNYTCTLCILRTFLFVRICRSNCREPGTKIQIKQSWKWQESRRSMLTKVDLTVVIKWLLYIVQVL